MTDLDSQAQDLLAAARRALSPSPGAKARVLLATRAVVTGALLHESPGHTDALAERAAGWLDRARALGSAWGSRVLIAAALTGSGFGAGYWAANRTSPPTPQPMPSLPTYERKAASSPVTEPTAIPEHPAGDSSPAPPALAPRKAASAEVPVAHASLDEEVRALKRVERALREHNPRFALALLDELEHSAPNGKLTEERQAAKSMAECELGPDSRAAILAGFIERFPQSAYRSRVEQVCAAEPEPAGP